jgi:hypothetical protein
VAGYLGIDPGKTTGWALFTDHTTVPGFASGQVEGRFNFYDWYLTRTQKHNPDAVVMEDYIITPGTAKKSQQRDPLLIIGRIEGDCYFNEVPFRLQSPAQGKSFGTDEKLHHFGWWESTEGGHANDAARHLLRYLAVDRRHPHILEELKEFAAT